MLQESTTTSDKTLRPSSSNALLPRWATMGFGAAAEYATDFWQRSLIFLDILRRSGDQQAEMTSRPINAVAIYDYEIILKGDSLPRPVNYALVRVVPPAGTVIDNTKRPGGRDRPAGRPGAGHRGIQAGKRDRSGLQGETSGLLHRLRGGPLEGQTIEDVAHAFTVFLEKVIELQPHAIGKPLVFGNCQAGWHAVMAACMRPDLVGPLVLPGAPLSYWAGVRGQNPMRYSGGLLGGTWTARLMSDLGGGIFDGAWLVSNFDSLNPANTFWTKQYNVWAKPEKEEHRYLEFEKWWGAFVHLRGEELQYMVDNLFVGNKLSTGQIVTKDGIRLDIRNIKSPILCFCSKRDNITPPQQALDWILDNYDSVDEIREQGQTILYCLHETAGHLAIFVSTKVAAKEDSQFINYMDMIDCMPPGLYEIVITDKSEGEVGAELLEGDFNVRIEERSLDDIRALGCNSIEDEREFEAVARVSQLNNALYSAFVRPWLRTWVTPQMASAVLAMQPLRLKYAICFGQESVDARGGAAGRKGPCRAQAPDADNPFLAVQEQVSEMVTAWLETLGQIRDQSVEAMFHAVYGSPWLQAWLGVTPGNGRPRPKPGTSPDQKAALAAKIEELRSTMDHGGELEAAVRALVYIAEGQRFVDARSFEILRRISKAYPEITFAHYKAVVREEWAKLALDEQAALEALPRLLPADAAERSDLFEKIRAIAVAAGDLDPEAHRRLCEMEALFSAKAWCRGTGE